MLAARREPTFDVSTPDIGDAPYAYTPPPTSRLSHWVNMFQLVGALVAVPVGLGSAYSLYRANFSPETTCHSLRAGIIAMLDKNVDATTRRILVRRDVEAFEQACGAVDPEATRAFKTLLAEDKTFAASPPAVAAPKVEHGEAAPRVTLRKAQPRPQAAAKPPAAVEPTRDEAADTQWLDAVRQAMAAHQPEPAGEPALVPTSAPAVVAAAPPPLAPPLTLAPLPQVAAPAPPADGDHPVPPGAIPGPAQLTAMKHEEPKSRFGRLIARVPLLGPVWENR